MVETQHVTSKWLSSEQHSCEALWDAGHSSEAALQDCISGLTMMCAGRKIVPLADHVQSLHASAVIET